MKNKSLLLNSLFLLSVFTVLSYNLAAFPIPSFDKYTSVDIYSFLNAKSFSSPSDTLEKKQVSSEQLSADFISLTPGKSSELGIEGGVKLVKLSSGILSNQSTIKEGFIITKINGKEIHSAEQLVAELRLIDTFVNLEGVYDDINQMYDDLSGTFLYEVSLRRQI
ncbi:MAG: hypothetical protein AAFY45_27285 [Bacteroidota bacterium]